MSRTPRRSAASTSSRASSAESRERLLDEDVLARLDRPQAERVVRRHRGRDGDGVELVVGEQLVERRP